MKKLLVVLAMVMVLANILSVPASACVVTDWLFGASDFMCSSTYEEQQDAAAMVAALIASRATGVDAQIIQSALIVLKNGGCFFISQLKEALTLVDAANASMARAKGPKFASDVKLPTYPALRKLVQ